MNPFSQYLVIPQYFYLNTVVRYLLILPTPINKLITLTLAVALRIYIAVITAVYFIYPHSHFAVFIVLS